MDIIFVRGLEIETIVGIFDWERVTPRKIILDLEMATDNPKAAATDSIEDALDYDAVSKRIIAFVESSRFYLIETLAERICEILLKEFKVPWVRLTLNKIGAVKGASDVGIIIERSAT